MWDPLDCPDGGLTLSRVSEVLPPLPPVPVNEIFNTTANKTIMENPSLFKIVCSINIDFLLKNLVNHPNPPLISSVDTGLKEGIWPNADTSLVTLPYTLDVKNKEEKEENLDFIRSQRDVEVASGCFSPAFPRLLGGMLTTPIVIAVNKRTGKKRMCVNHSAEPFARNDFIPKPALSVPLDNLHDLGRALIHVRKINGPDAKLVLWKSDVQRAHRQLPMHPLWQIKQIVRIDNKYHVDRCCNFGNRSSAGIWGYIFSLILWIAVNVKLIYDLFAYADDTFSWDFEGNMMYYKPYDTWYPSKQCRFLMLLDQAGLPHEKHKQLFGSVLTIIGFEVDANKMTITMPDSSRSDLVKAIREFAVRGKRPKLVDFQRLIGWINWALNTFPLLRPGLSGVYDKLKGKSKRNAEIYVNNRIRRELRWIANHIENSEGILMLESIDWPIESASLSILCDASLVGMGFWVPNSGIGFQCRTMDPNHPIFYWESLTVLAAIQWACESCSTTPRRLVIYTDNMNTVSLFDTLRATPLYNPIILTACELMISFNIQVRVLHLPGIENGVADALSRFDTPRALSLRPELFIFPFSPPHLVLGADLN